MTLATNDTVLERKECNKTGTAGSTPGYYRFISECSNGKMSRLGSVRSFNDSNLRFRRALRRKQKCLGKIRIESFPRGRWSAKLDNHHRAWRLLPLLLPKCVVAYAHRDVHKICAHIESYDYISLVSRCPGLHQGCRMRDSRAKPTEKDLPGCMTQQRALFYQ